MENISVTPFNIGHLRFDLTEIYNLPDDHSFNGQIAKIPMFSYHIALPGRSVLVDAVDYDLDEIPLSIQVADYKPPRPLLEQLVTKGNVYWASRKKMQKSKSTLMKRAAGSGGQVYFTHIVGSYRVVEEEAGNLVWRE